VGRAPDEFLGDMHGMAAREIKSMMSSADARERKLGLQLALRMLKENNITCTEANPAMGALKASVQAKLPTADELNRLMRLSPDTI
jgi:hypothetical protein